MFFFRGTGLAADSDRKEWPKYREIIDRLIYNKDFNDFNEQNGYRRYENDLLMPPNQAMTIYAYPEEYDYPEIKEYHPDWFNLEVFNKNESGEKIDLKEFLPKDFYENDLNGNWSGKWIYVSMGSMGSVDLNLMHRLIEVLSKTNHKYIVSKGALHEEYDLADNMWGEAYLPQIRILPLVDMVITHGGNNTVTETVSFGKPMLVMPLFADQYDNAQRIREKGFGDRIETYRFEDDKLIQLIDKILNDNEIHERCRKAAERIRSDESKINACRKIEKFFENFYSKK